MKYIYPNGTWYEGSVRNGLRHGYGVYKVPYDDITLCGLWKLDRFHFGMACHGDQIRYGFGYELYQGELLNRKSEIALVYNHTRKSAIHHFYKSGKVASKNRKNTVHKKHTYVPHSFRKKR